MTPTFVENAEIGERLAEARWCSIALCNRGAIVQRIRILPDGVVIEIDRPLYVEREPEIKNGHAAVNFSDCTVAWKLEAEKTK